MAKGSILLACAGAALLASCHRGEPKGQVVATVNGSEVTLQEVNAELSTVNLPDTVDKQAAQRIALDRVIQRKLVNGLAHDAGLDTSSEYLAQKRRSDQVILTQMYAKQQLAAIPIPSPAQITQFMSEHANAFGGRQQWVLDQIRFKAPANIHQLDPLEKAHTMDAVTATLNQLGIQYQRGPAGLDTANVPPNMMKALDALPANEPFVVPSNGLVTVNVIKERKPVAGDPAQARTAAVTAWRQQKLADMIDQRVTALKGSAKIDYQNGYGPPAAPAKTAAPAKAG